jgi:16S rRNA (uracil1498-N3)-methyltransferase
MPGARIHIAPERLAAGPGQACELQPHERHYLLDVLRLGPGDTLEVFDGRGGRAPARLARRADQDVLELTGSLERETLLGRRVRLGVALLKGRKLDDLVRRVTEVGVAAVAPFLSAHCVARPLEERRATRQERLEHIAAEAARQSGRADVPVVEPVRALAELLALAREPVRVLLDERCLGPRLGDLLPPGEDCLILVGPEGGFSPAEVAGAEAAGCLRGSLGRHVLRAETAALLAAGLACLDSAAIPR